MKNIFKNWKTTLAGALALLFQFLPALTHGKVDAVQANTLSVVAGSLGLGVAKDNTTKDTSK